MTQSAIARLEAAAAAGQDQQLSLDPAFASLSAGTNKCLALAACGGHLSTVQLLLKHQAYTPAAGGFHSRDAAWRDLQKALIKAARHGHLEVAAALLMVPTQTNSSIAGFRTAGVALDAAAAGGHRAIVQLICSSIPRQDVLGMCLRPVSWIHLAWDSMHAAQQGWSSFAWYSRFRPQLVLFIISLTAIHWAWAIRTWGGVPTPSEMWNRPLWLVVWALLTVLYWGV